MNLDKYLQNPESTPADYILHAVLVHSGDNHGGHYVVFINPNGNGIWCKFDDDVVSRCGKNEAIDQNFGGNDDELPGKLSTNAYMLVYIRESAITTVLQSVAKNDIPDQLIERLQEEKTQEALRRKERNEAHYFNTITAYTEDNLMCHKGLDLVNPEKTPCVTFKLHKTASYEDNIEVIANQMNYPVNGLRLWPFINRTSNAFRPSRLESNNLFASIESFNGLHVFVEMISPELPHKSLPLSNPKGSNNSVKKNSFFNCSVFF